MNNAELNWLLEHPEAEEKYAGEYIAIAGDGIIAHHKDFKRVWAEVKKRGSTAFIHRVMALDKELVV